MSTGVVLKYLLSGAVEGGPRFLKLLLVDREGLRGPDVLAGVLQLLEHDGVVLPALHLY